MCTYQTKQNFLFLKAFGSPDQVMGHFDVFSKVAELSLQDTVKCTYFVGSPRTLDALFEEANLDGYIKRVSAFGWKITDLGLRRKNFLQEKYITPSEIH